MGDIVPLHGDRMVASAKELLSNINFDLEYFVSTIDLNQEELMDAMVDRIAGVIHQERCTELEARSLLSRFKYKYITNPPGYFSYDRIREEQLRVLKDRISSGEAKMGYMTANRLIVNRVSRELEKNLRNVIRERGLLEYGSTGPIMKLLDRKVQVLPAKAGLKSSNNRLDKPIIAETSGLIYNMFDRVFVETDFTVRLDVTVLDEE